MKSNRLLSIVMVVCLVLLTIIYPVGANNHDETVVLEENENIPEYEEEIREKKKTADVFEIESLREERVKHFAQADGTIVAIVYPFPVHERNNQNLWEDLYEIDSHSPYDVVREMPSRDGNEITVNGYENYDTYISQNYPSTNFFGTSDKIVGTNEITYYYCANPDIPDNATVVSSSVSYYCWFPSGVTSGNIVVKAYEVIDEWDPFYITYNNSGVNNGLATTETDSQTIIASSNITSDSPVQCFFDVTELTKDWYSGKQNNGVGLKRTSGSVSKVYLCSNTHHWPAYSVTYTLDDLVVEDGWYLILNRKMNMCIQINENNGILVPNQAYMEVRQPSGEDVQQWYFKYLHNGYYKITSKHSYLSLAIKSGLETANNAELVQEAYSCVKRKQWHLSFSNSGNVIIRQRTTYESDYYSSYALMTFTDVGEGTKVVQSYYSNNTDLKDEWKLVRCGTEAFYLGINVGGNHDHISAFSSIVDNVELLGYSTFDVNHTSFISTDVVISKLCDSNLFVFRGHGDCDNEGGYIILSNGTRSSNGRRVYNYNNNQAIYDLSDNQIMLFVACYSGYGNHSIVDAAVAAGAGVAIGFTTNIDCSDANIWLSNFFMCLVDGNDIEEAAFNACNGLLYPELFYSSIKVVTN